MIRIHTAEAMRIEGLSSLCSVAGYVGTDHWFANPQAKQPEVAVS